MKNLTKRLPGAVMAAGALLAVSAADVARPGAGKAHHRHLHPAVARRAAAAGHQEAEIRREERPRHHLRRAAARCLCGAVQLRRVQDRWQRVADHARPRRRARRQGEVSVQHLRFLGHGRHLARQRQVAEGPRRQGARRARARPPTIRCTISSRAGQGVDVSKIKVVNTAPPGLISYAIADRADAVQIWEPAYTLMMTKKPSIRTLDLGIAKTWKAFAGGSDIPYLGVGAHSRLGRCEPGRGAEALHRRTSRPPIGSPRTPTRRRRCSPRAQRRMSSRRLPP